MHIHTFIHTYIHTRIHTNTYLHTYICTYILTHIHISTYIHAYIASTNKHTYIHARFFAKSRNRFVFPHRRASGSIIEHLFSRFSSGPSSTPNGEDQQPQIQDQSFVDGSSASSRMGTAPQRERSDTPDPCRGFIALGCADPTPG